jgi:hypothetical protein
MKGLASKSRKSWGWWGAKMNKTEEEILKIASLSRFVGRVGNEGIFCYFGKLGVGYGKRARPKQKLED